MVHKCIKCGAELTTDEMSLYKKLVFRPAKEFLCLDCMAEEMRTSRDRLEYLIDYYHRTGECSLFAKIEQS